MVSTSARRIVSRLVGNAFWGHLFFYFILTVLFYPVIAILFQFGLSSEFNLDELIWVLQNTFLQAILSTLLGLMIAIPISLGILGIHRRFGPTVAWVFNLLFVLPSLLPPLFIVLFFIQTLHPFPFGIIGLVLVQGVVLAGVFSLPLQNAMIKKLDGLALISQVFGAGPLLFWTRSLPVLRRDFLNLFVVGLSYCVASFSIPLLIGGGKYTTLEVLIFEKIRISQDWGQGAYLSLVQLALGFLLYAISQGLVSDGRESQSLGFIGLNRGQVKINIYLQSQILMFFVMLVSASVLALGFLHFFDGIKILIQHPEIRLEVLKVILPSLLVAGVASLVTVGFCFLLLCASQQKKLRFLLIGFITPSSAVLAFSWLVLTENTETSLLVKYISVLLIICIPSALRMFFWNRLKLLESQIETAKVLGGSDFLIAKKILWPQMQKSVAILSGIVGIWVLGDYAISRMMLSQTITLAMLMDSLISSYRLEVAFGVGACLLFLSLIYFALVYFLLGVTHADSKRS